MTTSKRPLGSFIENFLIRGAGLSTIGILFLIFGFLIVEGLPFIANASLWDFLTGLRWIPNSGFYGVVPLIVGSLNVTFVAILLAVPLSLATALFVSEIAGSKVRNIMKVSLEVLASVPSVVFGFIGTIFIAPSVQEVFGLISGKTAFTAAILLALMSVPTIASIAEEALQAVPHTLRETSLALGATKVQTMLKITFPAASSGIIAAIMLGIGRVIGETMTVMMVAGGTPNADFTLFESVRTITHTIAAEMGEVDKVSNTTHYNALFMLGIILFLITLGVNTLSALIINRIKRKHGV